MARSLRLSEKWFHRGLWLVAFIFASFLIGLGGTVVENLPKVERHVAVDDFINPAELAAANQSIKSLEAKQKKIQDDLDQARLKADVARSQYRAARESFQNWLATRSVTGRQDQDPQVIERTTWLDGLKTTENSVTAVVSGLEQDALNAQQALSTAHHRLNALQRNASDKLRSAQRMQELRIFSYRLALTLPLLLIAGWLFAKKRKSSYWPFVWGFIFFALFAFFVELVPYLPSYGGYVRYIVGIVLTVIVGRQAIIALNGYLQRAKAEEQKSEVERRTDMSYDMALARLTKGVCPGCERFVELKDQKNDFCPHCGIGLHNQCSKCGARKSSFSKFCHCCGCAASSEDKAAAQPV